MIALHAKVSLDVISCSDYTRACRPSRLRRRVVRRHQTRESSLFHRDIDFVSKNSLRLFSGGKEQSNSPRRAS